MAWRRRENGAAAVGTVEKEARIAGILPSRQQAHPALLRMLSRARRRQGTLLLVRLAAADGGGQNGGRNRGKDRGNDGGKDGGKDSRPGGEAGGFRAFRRFLEELGAELRICDLAWWEPGGVVMLLLEDAGAAAPAAGSASPAAGSGALAVIDRLERRALQAGARPQCQAARFPRQGLTLEALLRALDSTLGSAVGIAAAGPAPDEEAQWAAR